MSLLTGEGARDLSDPSKFGSVPFFTEGRVKRLREYLGTFSSTGQVSTPDAGINFEWNNRVMRWNADTIQPQGPVDPFYVPSHYQSPGEGDAVEAIIAADFEAAEELALRYVIRGEAAAGAAACRILQAWTTIQEFTDSEGSGLVWSDKWGVMMQAAMMLQHYGCPDYTPALHAAMQDVTIRGGAVESQFMTNNDNRGMWGVSYHIAQAVFLQNRAEFDEGIRKWRSILDDAVVNNHPLHEVRRQGGGDGDGSTGLWYSNFLLLAATVAAEWARFSGEWLYDYRMQDGSTFQDFYLQVTEWNNHPWTYPYRNSGVTQGYPGRRLPHDDILYALWPTQNGAEILARYVNGGTRDTFNVRSAILAYRHQPFYG